MDTKEKAPDPPKWVLELVDDQQTEQMLDIVNRQFPKWITRFEWISQF